MSEFRSRLERLGERANVDPDAFERLERARRRHERNRRITAGTVALLVAIAGSLAAFSAFRGSDGTVAGAEGGGFFALWPEQTEAGLAAAQDAVDRGDPDLAWRSDPIDVARRFATEKLLWPAVTVEAADGSNEGSDELVLDLTVPPGSSCDQIVTDAECPTTRTTVTMGRLGRPDGLWSIVEVHGEDLALPFVAGEVVLGGTWVSVPTNLPDGQKVAVGFAFHTACEATGVDDNIEARDGVLAFYVPAVPDGCTGYLYAMRPPTGVGAVAIGSFLLSDAPDIPSIGYLVQEISAVPVVFENDVTVEPAEEGRIACEGSNPIVRTPVVRTQPDGVHVVLSNPTDDVLSFSIESAPADSYDASVSSLEPGSTQLVLAMPPGTVEFSCSSEPREGEAGGAGLGSFEIVDPDGNYVSDALECDSGGYGSSAAQPANATGVPGEPLEVARANLTGLEPDDSVEAAGYSGSSSPVIRIVRDGKVVGRVTLADDGTRAWLMSSIEGCDGTSFGWTGSPSGASGPTGSPTGASGPTGPPSAWDAICSAARAGQGDNAHNGADLRVGGLDLRFDTRCLIAPVGEPVSIRFRNLDTDVQRNISIYRLTPFLRECIVTGTAPGFPVEHRIFGGEIITGVDEIVYEIGPLEAGEYYFQDDVHPSANGVLVVE